MRQKVILRNVTAVSVNYVWNNTIAVMNDKGRYSHLCNASYAYVSVATHTEGAYKPCTRVDKIILL
jgi:hypothetical protein